MRVPRTSTCSCCGLRPSGAARLYSPLDLGDAVGGAGHRVRGRVPDRALGPRGGQRRSDDGSYLVVLTPCDRRLGESVLAQAIEPGILPVNRWDLVRDAFGAKRLEPALTRSANSWLAEALLDAQPPGGWRKLTGPVLSRETALNRLAAVRLGLSADADDTAVDAAALLEWTHRIPAVSSFRKLRDDERDGIAGWLKECGRSRRRRGLRDVSRTEVDRRRPVRPGGRGAVPAQAPDQGEVLTARGSAPRNGTSAAIRPAASLTAFGEAAESLVGRWTDNRRRS